MNQVRNEVGSGGPAAGRANCLRFLADQVRGKTLQLLDWSHSNELTWTPPGTSNHILWHAGHALWVEDALCIQMITGKSELPSEWSAMFQMGSQPALQQTLWPSRSELRRQLVAQQRRLRDVIGSVCDSAFDALPPFPHPGDDRTLLELVTHGLHDEANHQGEMYLLLKMQRLATRPK